MTWKEDGVDSEWRTPEHEVYERMEQDAEAAERRGPWAMPSLDDILIQWRRDAFQPARDALAEDAERERAE